MKKKLIFLIIFSMLCSANGKKKPNFVLFYVEHIKDVFTDLFSPTLGEDLKNLNALREESIRFHNVYGEASSTSNFASLLTGRPAVDLGMIRGKLLPFTSFPSIASSGGLSTNERTIAKELRAHGYRSFFSGYWKMGLGAKGKNFPSKHGFDDWIGVVYPHNEWCEQDKSVITNQESLLNHPYLKLFYRTSFLWLLLFLFMTMLSWCRFISFELYVNLMVYTVSTGLAFYVLLHLFIVQRSASCVLYHNDRIIQQPYDMTNITLHFTGIPSLWLQKREEPFLLTLNYLKMMPPHIHSSYFGEGSSQSRRFALLELDWSIGLIMNTLKELNIYDDTIIIVTGGSSCSRSIGEPRKVYTKTSRGFSQDISIFNWDECFKAPLWIKDTSNKMLSVHSPQDVYEYFSITNLFHTFLHSINIDDPNPKSLFPVSQGERMCPIEQYYQVDKRDIGSNVTMIRNFLDGNENAHIQNSVLMTHYFNVQRAVMVTYKKEFQIIFYYLDAYKSLIKLDEPVVIDLKNSLITIKDEKIRNEKLGKIYSEISDQFKDHTQKRQSLNLWSSQFEMPVLPWLLPCENFPYCRTFERFHPMIFHHLFPKHS